MRRIKPLWCRMLLALLASATLITSTAAQTNPFPSNAHEFLSPDEAFQLNVVRADTGYVARWEIANKYYLYRKKIKIKAPGAEVDFTAPKGVLIRDEFFGKTQVFLHFVEVPFTLASENAEPIVSITYQGCADAGLCYSPITKQIALSNLSAAKEPATAENPSTQTPRAPVSEQFLILERLQTSHFSIALLAFLGFGLLLAFTPCVLPMVPILSGIIARGSETEKISAKRTFALSLSYVLAMAVTYSLFGIAMGLTGHSLHLWLQQPWVTGAFSMVFVILALSMFGLYELRMPSGAQARLQTFGAPDGNRSSLPGAALMGVVSALIVSPCVTAPLIGALLFIAQTGDTVLGGLALFFLALGMGIPLLIVGTSLGRFLPQPGAMLETVKPLFGLLLLSVAIWLLDRIVPSAVTLGLLGGLLALSANYLYQMTKQRPFEFGTQVLIQGLAVVTLLYSLLLITGAATGGTSLLRPLEHLNATPTTSPVQKQALDFKRVSSLADLQSKITLAEQLGESVMLYFHADWCVTCKELEAFTFSDPEVRKALHGINLLEIDVTENTQVNEGLLNHFGLFGPPAILFFDTHGYEVSSARVIGYMNADNFKHHLNLVFSTRRT